MTPTSSDHSRILAECYQILRQAAARAAQTQSEAAEGKSAAQEEERDDASVTSSR